jgi:hypothetical protein
MPKLLAWKGRKAPFGILRSLDVRDETKVGRKVLRLKVAVVRLSNPVSSIYCGRLRAIDQTAVQQCGAMHCPHEGDITAKQVLFPGGSRPAWITCYR